MILTVRLILSPKDEPMPEALDMTAENVVNRAYESLRDFTKHDEISGWLLDGFDLLAEVD